MVLPGAQAVKRAKEMSKYDTLSYLLGAYGTNQMNEQQFWAAMNGRGYTNDDIDAWCAEYYQREEVNDERRRKEAEDRTARTATPRYARGPDREEQATDRQERQGDRGDVADQGQGRRQGTRDEGGDQGQGEARQNWEIIDGEIWITLTPQMITWVDGIARERWRIAQAVGANNEGRDPERVWIDKRDGYRAEMAGRRFFGLDVSWSITIPVDGVHRPDFSDFIDVKGRTNSIMMMGVNWQSFAPHYAYLYICGAQHPRYRIIGWCWGHEVGARERFYDAYRKNRPAFWVAEDDPIMKSPFELRDLALAKVIK